MGMLELFVGFILIKAASPNIDLWNQHLETVDVNWKKSSNLTECLGSCLCSDDQADCSFRALTSLPSNSNKSLIIHTL